MDATPSQLDALFPHPGDVDLPNVGARRVPGPVRQAGWTDASTHAVLALLRENHQRWHIFFNEQQFHNHCSHHLLAIYAMGADEELLRAAYQTHVVYQKPAFPPPEHKKIDTIISDANWKDHVGDERYYQAYVAYFTAKLVAAGSAPEGIKALLEDFVFSKDANLVPGKPGEQGPLMLSRFLAGFLHPLIHCGCAAEFGLPGLVAEGIAQATAQPVEAISLFTPSLFDFERSTGTASSLSSLFSSFTVGRQPPATTAPRVHALTVLARIAKDPAFAPGAVDLPRDDGDKEGSVDRVVRIAGKRLVELAEDWVNGAVGDLAPQALSDKFEEIAWLNAVIYAVGGWAGRKQSEDEKKEFNADFFLMHLVTSSLFIPTLLNILTPASSSLLLRTYFIFSLVLYVARGRPPLPISAFYAHTTARPVPPPSSTASAPAKDTLPPTGTPNPWLAIVQTTLVHPNEHLCKLQRSLWHYADVYGGRPKGRFASPEAVEVAAGPEGLAAGGLEGLAELDGTLFVRAAGLTADRLNWMREGEEQRSWDNGGFFKDEW